MRRLFYAGAAHEEEEGKYEKGHHVERRRRRDVSEHVQSGHRVEPPASDSSEKQIRSADPITAEQIVREAKERQDDTYIAPRQKITNTEELYEYRLKKRKEFEDVIRRTYWDTKVWTRYAKWEEGQGISHEHEASGNGRSIKIIKKCRCG